MQGIDILVVLWVAAAAVLGLRRGLSGQVIVLLGFAVGAAIGSRLAPTLLAGGERSPWQPMAALAGAITGGLILQIAATPLADALRRRLPVGLGTADRAGGMLSGALLGTLAVWMLAVAALHQPALGIRPLVQRSAILPALVHTLPEHSLLRALQTFDRLPVIAAATGRQLPAPDASIPTRARVLAIRPSVVRVEGAACGLGVQGSGWVVRPGLVATNAHVVAGVSDPEVVAGADRHDATVVFVSARSDIALLRVAGLDLPALRTAADPGESIPVALAGYPGGGAYTVSAGSAGRPVTVLAPDAYQRGIRPRTVVPLRGPLRHGMSGGPVVDARGRVVAMMFGASEEGGGGFAVPVEDVLGALADVAAHADTGPCVR
jgi:S1-C subfamily serine protease